MLNFFARSGPKIEKIDSLFCGEGIAVALQGNRYPIGGILGNFCRAGFI
jgi:hypothetical protein